MRLPHLKQLSQAYKSIGIFLAVCSIASGRIPPFEYGFLEKELHDGARNHVEFAQVADTPIVYRAWGVWKLGSPASEAADVALDFYNYSSIFRNVYRCERIMAPKSRVSPLGTWYVEGRASLARVWSIGNIETLTRGDSCGVTLLAGQNEDRYLEATWSRSEHGWLNYRTYGLRLAAFIVPMGTDSCRVGIVTQGIVKQAMPTWLIRMALKIILPHIIEDLQTEVKRRSDLKKPKPLPWYEQWLQGMRHLF